MLTCIALAGSLYFQIEHDPSAGVTTSGAEWERLIPVDGTMITRGMDHNAADRYIVWFYPIAGSLRLVYLNQARFPNWSPADLLAECEDARR